MTCFGSKSAQPGSICSAGRWKGGAPPQAQSPACLQASLAPSHDPQARPRWLRPSVSLGNLVPAQLRLFWSKKSGSTVRGVLSVVCHSALQASPSALSATTCPALNLVAIREPAGDGEAVPCDASVCKVLSGWSGADALGSVGQCPEQPLSARVTLSGPRPHSWPSSAPFTTTAREGG